MSMHWESAGKVEFCASAGKAEFGKHDKVQYKYSFKSLVVSTTCTVQMDQFEFSNLIIAAYTHLWKTSAALLNSGWVSEYGVLAVWLCDRNTHVIATCARRLATITWKRLPKTPGHDNWTTHHRSQKPWTTHKALPRSIFESDQQIIAQKGCPWGIRNGWSR